MGIKNIFLSGLLVVLLSFGVGCHSNGAGFEADGGFESGDDSGDGSGEADPVFGSLLSLEMVRLDGVSIDLENPDVPIPSAFAAIVATYDGSVSPSNSMLLSASSGAFTLTCNDETVSMSCTLSEGDTVETCVPGKALDRGVECEIELPGSSEEIQFATMTPGSVMGGAYAELIVGARYEGLKGGDDEYSGIVYIYSGDDLVNPSMTIDSPLRRSFFGSRVVPAGDMNGDGYADFAIGAFMTEELGDPPDTENTGALIYIFSGKDLKEMSDAGEVNMSIDDALAVFSEELGDPETEELFDFSVDAAGDVNGDGFDDIVVGFLKMVGDGPGVGKVFIIAGSAEIPQTLSGADALATITPSEAGTFALRVAGAGDVNGDTLDDIIVGSPAMGTANAYIFSGAALNNNSMDEDDAFAKIAGVANAGEGGPGDLFGLALEGVGDLDDDGYDDILIGASLHHDSDFGAVYLFSGAVLTESGGILSVDAALNMVIGTDTYVELGIEMVSVGDVTGDGVGDFMVGSRPKDSFDSALGAVHLISGADMLTGLGDVNSDGATDINDYTYETATIERVQDDGGVGNIDYNIGSSGNFVGDDSPDILIGEYKKGNRGKIHIFDSDNLDGDMNVLDDPDITVESPEEGDQFGYDATQADFLSKAMSH